MEPQPNGHHNSLFESTMTYHFEEYSPEHKSQVATLRSKTWGGGIEFSTRYFEWKYEQNPYLAKPHFYVAIHEGKVVAMRGFYGSRWQARDRSDSLLIPIGGDLAVDPEHRRRRLASKMIANITPHMTAKGYRYLMNLSANPSSRDLQIKSGYPRVAPYHTFQRGNPSTRLLARVFRRVRKSLVGRRDQAPFERFDTWAANARGSITGASEPRVSEMGELVLRCAEKLRIRLVRDATYYRWRFLNPSSQYRFIFCDDNGGLTGFLALQSPKGGGSATIVDWEASTTDIWIELVAAAIDSNAKPLRITSTTFTKSQMQSLQDLGFAPMVERDNKGIPAPGMLLHISPEHAANEPRFGGLQPLDANSWDIRMIASDAF